MIKHLFAQRLPSLVGLEFHEKTTDTVGGGRGKRQATGETCVCVTSHGGGGGGRGGAGRRVAPA